MSEEQKLMKWVGVGYAGKVAKAALVGIATLTAGVSADTPAGTALVNPDDGNETARRLGLDQKGFSKFSNQTDLERHLRNVTPEQLKQMGVKNPERFIENVQKLEQNLQQREQKRGQRQEQRQQLVENTQKALEDLRKLFEEMPEKVKNRKIDIGTERLTPEKINPRVWESVGRMLTERRELNDNTGASVVLVHGIAGVEGSGSGNGVDCNGGYWGDAISFLQSQGYTDVRTVKYYTGDYNCDADLHVSSYEGPCANYSAGNEGTNNEDLDHISCLLAQYLYQEFGQSNQNVALVGHSMGGIIVRNTMTLMQKYAGDDPFPSSIGTVTDAVTLNTPHGGVPSAGGLVDLVACGGCTQVAELVSGSDFLSRLSQNPQTSTGFTKWTVIGSDCDLYVSGASAVDMEASHAVVYTMPNSNICYDHGGALHDKSTAQDAPQYYCDTSDPTNSPCGTDYLNLVGPWKTRNGPRGLTELSNAISE